MRTPLLGVCLALLTTSSALATVIGDFNNSNALDSFNNEGNLEIRATEGIGGTGGLYSSDSTLSAARGLAYTETSYDMSAMNVPYSVSVFFRSDRDQWTSNTFASDRTAGIGIGSEPGADDLRNRSGVTIGVSLGGNSSGFNNGIAALAGAADGSGYEGSFSGAVLTDGNWYKLAATFTQTSVSTWDISATVTDFGADGLTMGATVITLNDTIDGGSDDLSLDADSYVVLVYGENDRMGVDGYDDLAFTQIPEPSVLSLFGLGGVLLLVLGRRR